MSHNLDEAVSTIAHLPVGSVVLDYTGTAWQRGPFMWGSAIGGGKRTTEQLEMHFPFLILHVPEVVDE